ncbi:hypothetical protein SD70_30500 [Gordoniibacillus kamchatkensis]|uniref:Uncharacterized protein n=1 Tax=Gordoniibacillus kamchatkensis TaxID=1590651 RepID=A0ABR5AAE6_9BACL|nr:hypothetical protein [Paenibacillus sp. VKM B-2647]KIL37808.1 hypothetical protein SD70_30500 [Paenibacillus sp. VKM B-2647]
MKWIIKTKHQREDGGTAALELETEDLMFDVNARWDGCMEIHMYETTEENRELKDTLHTCDIRQLIETLQSLEEACRDFFGTGSYWEDRAEEPVSYNA